MSKEKENKNIVVRHNSLINSKMDLSLLHMRLFLKTLSLIKRDDDDTLTYTISVAELFKEAGVNTNNWRLGLKEEVTNLLNIKIEIPREGKSWLIANLFSMAEYIDGRGELQISFDKRLKPYINQLKGNFTSYELKYAIQMKSVYSIRIYELLKQYVAFGKRKFTLEALRNVLSLEDKYPNFAHFKKNVLDKAQEDCERYSDISFTYSLDRKGKKVVGITCHIKRQKEEIETDENGTPTIPITHSDFSQTLFEIGLTPERVSELFVEFDKAYMEYVFNKCKGQNPKKLDGFFIKALREGYYKQQYEKDNQQQTQKKQAKQVLNTQKEEERYQRKLEDAFFTQQEQAIKKLPSPTFDDRKDFESIMQERIAQTPAFKITYERYLKEGTSAEFTDFLLRKYSKPENYDIEAFKKAFTS